MFSAHVFADIYKCTGDGGAPTFVDGNTKANYKNCQLIMRDNLTQSASSKKPTRPGRCRYAPKNIQLLQKEISALK